MSSLRAAMEYAWLATPEVNGMFQLSMTTWLMEKISSSGD